MGPRAEIWLADAGGASEEQLAAYLSWLGPGEVARHARFVRPLRRRQFLVGRALLRMALGRLLEVAPADVALDQQPGCAPHLVSPDDARAVAGLSVSHSGRWAACAVSAQTQLGLDIEVMNAGRDLAALAEQAFDAAACARLAALSPALRVPAFYEMWSEQEARIKLGAGGEEGAQGSCIALPHPELSIVLCSAQALAEVPKLTAVTLI
ncbi:MAG: 4-phosphopantetheinyl transferase [Pseudomonadota bacterium]